MAKANELQQSTQFTCFAGTKAQILTPKEQVAKANELQQSTQFTRLIGTKAQTLTTRCAGRAC